MNKKLMGYFLYLMIGMIGGVLISLIESVGLGLIFYWVTIIAYNSYGKG